MGHVKSNGFVPCGESKRFFFGFFFLFATNFGNIPRKPFLFWNLGRIINFLLFSRSKVTVG